MLDGHHPKRIKKAKASQSQELPLLLEMGMCQWKPPTWQLRHRALMCISYGFYCKFLVPRWMEWFPSFIFVDALGKHPLCHRMCKVTKETSGANNIMRNVINSTSIAFRWTSSSSRQSVFSTTTIAKKAEEWLFGQKVGPWTSEPLLG